MQKEEEMHRKREARSRPVLPSFPPRLLSVLRTNQTGIFSSLLMPVNTPLFVIIVLRSPLSSEGHKLIRLSDKELPRHETSRVIHHCRNDNVHDDPRPQCYDTVCTQSMLQDVVLCITLYNGGSVCSCATAQSSQLWSERRSSVVK
ncbi:hypothetical protein JOB18_010031 [Solea senegalensis]|uniref:Uncharacterized protein n=1 Tax=Solea senegalensis TaxID=28829 RepID=A0AAV6PLC9_SOLSE|nr:hypothetical protein JOB18_010031 [Solea senegalensis]